MAKWSPLTAARIGERSAGETEALGCGSKPNGCQRRTDLVTNGSFVALRNGGRNPRHAIAPASQPDGGHCLHGPCIPPSRFARCTVRVYGELVGMTRLGRNPAWANSAHIHLCAFLTPAQHKHLFKSNNCPRRWTIIVGWSSRDHSKRQAACDRTALGVLPVD
jgi:hypothetical protein